MQKVITLRYQAKCRKCGETIPAGSQAIWLGSKNGVTHRSCVKPGQEIESPATENEGLDTLTIDYHELREAFSKFVENPMSVYKDPRNRSAGNSLQSNWKSDPDWTGCSIPEMQDWIRNGYRVEGLDGVSSLIPARPRRKLRYSDEGDELLLDLAWSGSDEPFAEWEKRISKPGLSVELWINFSANFPAKTIVAYQRWIARALQTLDENGVDMEVNVVTKLRGLYADARNVETKTMFRVRKAGEAADFSNWSAMFSPGGFRMLNIMGSGIHADRKGHQVSGGYGFPQDYGKWTVAYDEERNIIVIGNSNYDREFPELEMTDKLGQVLRKIAG